MFANEMPQIRLYLLLLDHTVLPRTEATTAFRAFATLPSARGADPPGVPHANHPDSVLMGVVIAESQADVEAVRYRLGPQMHRQSAMLDAGDLGGVLGG
jgi:hypothetical protein